jgi:acetate kinase
VPDDVLTINAGSSSVKFSLWELRPGGGLGLLYRGQVEGIGRAPAFHIGDGSGNAVAAPDPGGGAERTHEELFQTLLDWIDRHRGGARIVAAGHRIVHGGPDFATPLRIDAGVLATLEALVPLAPLHQPHNTKAVRALLAVRPDLPQIATFDTAFHRGHAPEIARFALPREFAEAGLLRYGFHGLSYEYIARALPRVAPEIARGRIVVLHLGNGASLCALDGGRSVDSTMSFTPLDGLVMGTRCGALDPGAVLYLIQQRSMNAEAVSDLLHHKSGLLGVSGIGSDMRDLLASPAPGAAAAIDMFVLRAAQAIGAAAVTLGGLDGIVFTAGIGENAPQIRARICERAAIFGIALDDAANRRSGPRITRADSRVSAWVIPTDEEAMIAEHTVEALGLGN